MTELFPNTGPLPELIPAESQVDLWLQVIYGRRLDRVASEEEKKLCAFAARWGGDVELAAVLKWLQNDSPPCFESTWEKLKSTRRPNLKEEALKSLAFLVKGSYMTEEQAQAIDTITKALERLQG